MVTYAELRDIVPSAFGDAATAWTTFATALHSRVSAIGTETKPLSGWHGDTAETATAQLSKRGKEFATAASTVTKIGPVLQAAGATITTAHKQLQQDIAKGIGAGLVNDGQGHFRPGPPSGALGIEAQKAETQRLQGIAHTINASIAKAIQQATTTDQQAAQALAALSAKQAGLAAAPANAAASAGAAKIPPAGTSPAEVKKWWDKLSIQDRESLLFSNPGQIGKLDGIPAEIRDRANRSVLAETTSYYSSSIQELQHKGNARTPAETAHLTQLENQYKGIKAISDAANDPKATGNNRVYVLGLDTAGDGKAIVSIGNPDTANNVATVVPGTGASLSQYSSDINRANALHGTAGGSNATIAWLGYDAPNAIPNAASEKYADGGAADLRRFQDGLGVTHQGHAHYTVISHSYGTTVVGHAARDGHLNADDLVFVASPGVGVDNVNKLHINHPDAGNHVYTLTSSNDAIGVSNIPLKNNDGTTSDPLGPDPHNPHFGGQQIPSKPRHDNPVDVHGQYFDWNTKEHPNTDLPNITRVVNAGPADHPRFEQPPPDPAPPPTYRSPY